MKHINEGDIMSMIKVEQKTMKKVIPAYTVMSIVGISTFFYSNSQAVLIDGVFNLISAITLLIGIKVTNMIELGRNKKYPFGFAMFETLYTLFKVFLMLGITTMAFFSNLSKIISYLLGKEVSTISNPNAIFFYSIAMVLICGATYLFIKKNSSKIDNKSIMLNTEKIGVLQNGVISGGIGVAILIIGLLEGTALSIIIPIGDSIIVLILCLILVGDPLIILNKVIKELTLHATSKDERLDVTENIEGIIPDYLSTNYVAITQLGRTKFYTIFIKSNVEKVSISELDSIRHKIRSEIKNINQYSLIDIIFTNITPGD